MTLLQVRALDLESARGHLAADPSFRPVLDKVKLEPRAPASCAFRELLASVVSQQLSGRVAETIWARVTALVGDPPPVEAVQAAGFDALRSVGLSAAKARTALALAEAFAEGRLSGPALQNASDDEVAAMLTQVKGVGPWTAQMFLMFGLHRPDILPVGDLGIRKAMARLAGVDGYIEPAEMEAMAEPWRPWRTVACLYLWRTSEPNL